MTTINPTYLLIRLPAQPVSVRCFAVTMGRDITNSQVTAEQTAAIIEREVGRLLQLALASAQIPGVTPASGSVYAQAAPTAAANAAAVRAELSTELVRLTEAWGRLGLDPSKPLVTGETSITFGDIVMAMSQSGSAVTVARQ